MTSKFAMTLAAFTFAASFATLANAAEPVTSGALDHVSHVQGRASMAALPSKTISVREISDVSRINGRSSEITGKTSARVTAIVDLMRFGRA